MSNARAQTDWVLAVVCPQVGLVLGYGRAKRYSIPPGIVLLLAVLIKWLPCRQLQRAQARPKVTENRSIIFPRGTFLWNNYC